MSNDAVGSIADTAPQWLGEWPVNYGYWIDNALLLVKQYHHQIIVIISIIIS